MMMHRRSFLPLLMGSATLSSAAFSGNIARIGVLSTDNSSRLPNVIINELAALGLRPGIELVFEYPDALLPDESHETRANNLVLRNPDLIVAMSSPAANAAAKATRRIPIIGNFGIFGGVQNQNYGHPTRNVTGIAANPEGLQAKRASILKELVPSAKVFYLLGHPDPIIHSRQVKEIEESLTKLGVEIKFASVKTGKELENAFDSAKELHVDGVITLPGIALNNSQSVGKLATEYQIPSMLLSRAAVKTGGLVSYFSDVDELYMRMAHQIKAVLGGQSPADIAVERPRRFKMFINLNTTRKLGLEVPPSIMISATEVIE